MRSRVILLNHTDPTHPGCRLTCDRLSALIQKYGVLTRSYPTPRHAPDNQMSIDYDDTDVVLVNGEGTMHHHAPQRPRHAAAELHRQATIAKQAGCRVALINTVLDGFEDDLSVYDYIAVRESRSYGEAAAKHGRVDLVPDACFHHLVRQPKPRHASEVLVTDSIIRDVRDQLRAYAERHGHRFVRFRRLRPEAAIRRIMRARLVITGRYHGAIFALMTRTPVLCLASNSHKIQGLLHDFGIEQCLIEDPDHLPDHVPVSDRELPPLQDRIEAMMRRAILGDEWDAAPATNGRDTMDKKPRGFERLARNVRRRMMPVCRRHMIKFPPRFIRDLPGHGGYREIVWQGEVVGRLRPLQSLRRADRRDVFIFASGPSIRDVDPGLMRGGTCFAVNGSIVKFRQHRLAPDYYIVVDKDFVQHRFDLLQQGLASGARCLFSSEILLHICRQDPRVLGGAAIYLIDPIETRYGHDLIRGDDVYGPLSGDPDFILGPAQAGHNDAIGFSRNLDKGFFLSKTVVIPALQAAYYLGTRRAFVLGMDMRHEPDQTRFYDEQDATRPCLLEEFFDSHILPSFAVLRDMNDSDPFEVYNVGRTSRLPASVLPKIDLAQALTMTRPRREADHYCSTRSGGALSRPTVGGA